MHPRRLQEFNYVGPQAYFLTICTANRRKVFRNAASSLSRTSNFCVLPMRTGFK